MGWLMPTPGYTVIVHRAGSVTSRQYEIPVWLVRFALVACAIVVLGLLVLAVAYGPIVAAAARTPLLERRVSQLTQENAKVRDLARELVAAESSYARLRVMMGAAAPPPARDSAARYAAGEAHLYVAPPILALPAAASSGKATASTGPSIPHRWPLSVPSFRTRGMVADTPSEEVHPGIDLAVPEGSDVRAAGGGVVERTGTDSSYGLFVLLEHPAGYETMYGHLSRVLVSVGDSVEAGQVIALSGNTGRSTAPHLHFEVRRFGRSIDPLSVVREGH
jgi:murein DD-endopeptidase MepM/ murein hydrolase activator NlpD